MLFGKMTWGTLFVGVALAAATPAKDVEARFKLRSVHARERLAEIAKKKAAGAKLTPREECDEVIANGFVGFTNAAIEKTLVERKGPEIRYHIVLMNGSAVTRLVYVYKDTKTEPDAVIIQELGPDWTVTAPVGDSRAFLLRDAHGCTFRFAPDDPFAGGGGN